MPDTATKPSLSTHRRWRLVTLCAMYFAQGLPWGFMTVTLVAWLAKQGSTTDETGSLLFWCTVPWSIKFLWGPVIDRFTYAVMGRRRPWILLAQAVMLLSMLALCLLTDVANQLVLLSWLLCFHNIACSLQDVAVDALAVDILTDDERGKANGLMWGSKFLGIAGGGAGIATVMAATSFNVAVLVQVVTLLGLMLFPLLLRERPEERLLPWTPGQASPVVVAARPESMSDVFKSLFKAMRLRSSIMGAVFALLCSIPVGIAAAVGPVLITQELGWTSEFYAQIAGGPGMIAGLAAAIVGGWIVDRLGARTTIGVGYACLALNFTVFGLFPSLWASKTFVIINMCGHLAFFSLATVAKFSLFMRISWTRIAGTQFTGYMAFLNASTAIGYVLAGPVDRLLSYPNIYLVCAAGTALVILLLPLIDPTQTQRELNANDLDLPPGH
jgi:PAT family beta-lactamase induction signal transducer AmpG